MKRITRTWTYTAEVPEDSQSGEERFETVFAEAYTQGDGEFSDTFAVPPFTGEPDES